MTRIAVVGAGLAGSSLVHWLLKSGFDGEITLFDAKDPMTASVGPTLLCHPFPGRSLAPHRHLHDAINATTELLNDWRTLAPELIRPIHMWRPLKGSNLKRLSQSHQDWWVQGGKHTSENPWIENPPTIDYVSENDLDRVPTFNTPYPTLKTGPAFAIDAAELYPIIHQGFAQQGINITNQTVSRIVKTDDKWSIETKTQSKSFNKVILAFGRQSQTWFPHLDISLQSGSLMKATPNLSAKIESLSLNGLHIGQHHDGDWVFGSTRWSDNQPSIADEQRELISKLTQTLPFSPDMNIDQGSIWSGTRTIYGSDRMPLCGELPQHRNIFVLTALGSKGWLWGPWSANLLVKRIVDNQTNPAFNTVGLMRANAEDGWYSPFIKE